MIGQQGERAESPASAAGRQRGMRLLSGRRWIVLGLLVAVAGSEGVWLYLRRPLDPDRVVRETLALAQQAEASSARSAELQQQVLALKEEALALARSLVQQYPASADAWCVLGLVASRCGNRAGAVRCWERSLELAPQFSLAWHCLGRDALQRGEYPLAVQRFRKALQAEPDVPEVLLALADALSHMGQMAEALEVCKQHVALAPHSVEGWYRLGQIHVELGQYSEAKQCYARAVERDPDCKLALHGLALVCERLGETSEARKYRQAFAKREARDRAPGDNRRPKYDDLAATRDVLATTCSAAARVYAAMGDVAAAEASWRRGAQASPNSVEPRLDLLGFYEEQKRLEDALPLAEELCRLQPQSVEHLLRAGWLSIRLGRWAQAEDFFRRATEVAPRRPEGFVALAQFHLSQDRAPAQAKEAAARAVALAPIAAHYYLLGTACRRTGHLEEARQALEQAARLDPGKPEYRQALTGVLAQLRLLPPVEAASP